MIEHTPSASEQVKNAGEAALEKYTDISGRTSKIEYKDSLSDDTCSGGIIGSMMQGRIKVDNTLDERLKILEEMVRDFGPSPVLVAHTPRQMLPEIRTDLFGKNPNRRFYHVSCASGSETLRWALIVFFLSNRSMNAPCVLEDTTFVHKLSDYCMTAICIDCDSSTQELLTQRL